MAGIKIDFGANTTPFNQAMADVKNSVNNLASSLAGKLGAAVGFSGLVYSAGRYIEKLDQIADDSRKLGVSTDFFQKLNFAAERSGASIENVESAIKRLSRNIYDLSTNEKGMIQNFAMLGLTFDELKDKTPEEQFKIVVDSLNKITNATEKSALPQKVFGKSGAELLLMFKDYKDLADEISEKGLIKESTIKAADQLADRFTDIKTSLAALVSESTVFEVMAKGMNELVEGIYEVRKSEQLLIDNRATGIMVEQGGFTTEWSKSVFESFSKVSKSFYNLIGAKELSNKVMSGEQIYDYLAGNKPGTVLNIPAPNDEDWKKIRLQKAEAENQKALDKKQELVRANALKDVSNTQNKEKIAEDKKIKEAQYDYMLLVQKNRLSEQEFERFKLIAEYNKKIAEAKSQELKNVLESAKQEELASLDKKQLESGNEAIDKLDSSFVSKKIEDMPIRELFGGSGVSQENITISKLNKLQEKSLEYQKQAAESLKEIERKSVSARYS